jgi:D-glycero-D-manno-heptose 1,7-bisphosphate phosphatase
LRRAVFLDRDGTLMIDRGYLADPAGVELVPGATHALSALRELGALLVLVSNQSGLARGMVKRDEHARVHARFCELLALEGVVLDGAYYCEHGPDDGCECRKPRDGLLRTAARMLDVDLARSVMVGDKGSDVAAGRAAGCATALLASAGDADVVACDWATLLPCLTERFP